MTQKRKDMPAYEVEVEGPEFFIATSSYHALTYPLKLRSVHVKVHRKALEKLPKGSLLLKEHPAMLTTCRT